MKKSRVLLVEGRGAGPSSLAPAMRKVGLDVNLTHTGKAARSALDKYHPDLIVFDASTQRSSGDRTCRLLRRAAGAVPIIHCRSANQEVGPKVDAEVFLVRPFSSRKLLNRIRTLLPADPSAEEIVRAGRLVLYRKKRSVNVDGQGERRLTPKQFELLDVFLRHAGEVLDRRYLMQAVWKTDFMGDTRTLDVHVRWLRELIEINPTTPQLLRTMRGVGYVLDLNVETPQQPSGSAPRLNSRSRNKTDSSDR